MYLGPKMFTKLFTCTLGEGYEWAPLVCKTFLMTLGTYLIVHVVKIVGTESKRVEDATSLRIDAQILPVDPWKTRSQVYKATL